MGALGTGSPRERRDGSGERAASPPAVGSACGVWSGYQACVCQVGKGGRTAFLSLFLLYLKDGKGCNDFPGWRGRQQQSRRENIPKTEGRRRTFPVPSTFPECGMWHRPLKSRSDSPARAFLLPPIPGYPVCVCALGEAGGIGKFQHLRRSALWSLEGNGYFSNVFTSDHPLCPWWGWCWRTAVEC